MTELIRFEVDGREVTLAAPPDEPLLQVLRDRLGLVTPREACGIGICGSCTVTLDGRQVSSCLVLAGQVADREVETLDALTGPAPDDGPEQVGESRLHPIQQAFLEMNAFQCSYCTPGFLMATRELLSVDPDPTRETVRHFLAGNLCRCGSYARIEDAVLLAAARMREGAGEATEGSPG